MGRAPEPRRRQRGSVQVAECGSLIRNRLRQGKRWFRMSVPAKVFEASRMETLETFEDRAERYLQEAERVRGAAEATIAFDDHPLERRLFDRIAQ